jgi:hypothetical protein
MHGKAEKEKAPPADPTGLLALRGRFLFAFAADDAACDADSGWDHQVETFAAFVGPDGAYLVPFGLPVGSFLGVYDDVCGVGWSVAHDVSPSI